MSDLTANSILRNGVEDRKSREATRSLSSMSLAMGILFGALLYPALVEYFTEEPKTEKITVEAKKVINYSQLSAPPPIDLEKPDPELFKVPPKAKQKKFIQPVPKKDEEVLEEEYIPTMNELEEAQISTIDAEGVDSVIVDVDVEVEAPAEPAEILSFVEVMPTFVGGDEGLMRYLGENLSYPDVAKDVGIEGLVYIRFVIEPTGEVADVTVIRGIFGPLDEEAVRVIKNMPNWNPGIQNGRKVRVYYTIPIRFDLR